MSESNRLTPAINLTNEEYGKLTEKISPKPTVLKNAVAAFLMGGLICSLGQIIINFYMNYAGLAKLEAQTAGSATLVFIGALLTGFGVYDEIVRVGGAGGIVPITGFANAMVSPALEFKREGYVLGIGGKLFAVAGPILVYGIASSIVVGIISYFLK